MRSARHIRNGFTLLEVLIVVVILVVTFIGPFIYGLSVWLTGSTRMALLSLVVFFILGGAVLYRVDVTKGRADAALAR